MKHRRWLLKSQTQRNRTSLNAVLHTEIKIATCAKLDQTDRLSVSGHFTDVKIRAFTLCGKQVAQDCGRKLTWLDPVELCGKTGRWEGSEFHCADTNQALRHGRWWGCDAVVIGFDRALHLTLGLPDGTWLTGIQTNVLRWDNLPSCQLTMSSDYVPMST